MSAKIEGLEGDVEDHETRIRTLESAVGEIQHTLRDLRNPPRWVQTLLLSLLVLKEIVWPLIMAMRG